MGHLLTSPLPTVATIAEARSAAARMFAADAVVPFAPVFFEAPFGPIAVFSDGTVRQAELISGAGTGLSRVVVA